MAKLTREAIINSVHAMAQAVLDSNALKEHKQDFLRDCIWIVTETDGKFNVRYWSEGVYELVQKYGDVKSARKHASIRHEHVSPRKCLADKIMGNPTSLKRVLWEEAIACLVTKEEHDRLDHDCTGFVRYKMAGIRVWDTQKQVWTT